MWTGEKIKALRKRLGERQAAFAEHFRVSVETIRVWEQEKNKVRPGGPAQVILDQLAEKADALDTLKQPA